MAKLSSINKNNRRIRLSDKFYKKREKLKKIIIVPGSGWSIIKAMGIKIIKNE